MKKYAPKWAIKHAITQKYLGHATDGNHRWHDHWKHATKFQSHYKAKAFMEENVILMCIPEEIMPASDDKFDYQTFCRTELPE